MSLCGRLAANCSSDQAFDYEIMRYIHYGRVSFKSVKALGVLHSQL